MTKRWFLAALASLGLVGPAAAQMPVPMPMPGQGPPVYQAQFCGDPQTPTPPQFCGGPMGPPAPAGGDFNQLPNDGSGNAFTDQECGCRDGFCCGVNIGAMGLQRQSLGNSVIAFVDPGIVINGQQIFANTGNLPPPGSPVAISMHDISPDMQGGVRAALLFREPEWAVEICGFYLADNTVTHTASMPAQLDLLFNFFPTPIGFTPGNGLWLQDDIAQLKFSSQMYNGEFNYRWDTAKNVEWLAGLRYIGYNEALNITTEQAILRTGVFDPNTTATVTSSVHNRIVGLQLGVDINQRLTEHVGIGGTLKGVWGANFADIDRTVERGDGFFGPGVHHSETQFSHAYEADVYADFCITEQWRIRAGFQCLGLVDVPLAPENMNYDLGNLRAPFNRHSSVIYYGPMLEMQFIF
jgi:hypothetical protein